MSNEPTTDELKLLIQFVSQCLIAAEQAVEDDLPVKATGYREEAIAALSKHAGPWCREASALSSYSLLSQVCSQLDDQITVCANHCIMIDELRARARAAEATVAEWNQEISAVMPADFKDWHENAVSERPAVTAAVIRSLHKQIAFENSTQKQVSFKYSRD